jgi:hypothetical protein
VLLPRNAPTGKREHGSTRVPDGSGQQPSATVAGDEAEAHETLRETGFVAGDSDVAHQRQIASGADCGTVDCGDDRYVAGDYRSG